MIKAWPPQARLHLILLLPVSLPNVRAQSYPSAPLSLRAVSEAVWSVHLSGTPTIPHSVQSLGFNTPRGPAAKCFASILFLLPFLQAPGISVDVAEEGRMYTLCRAPSGAQEDLGTAACGLSTVRVAGQKEGHI